MRVFLAAPWRKQVPGLSDRWLWEGLILSEAEVVVRNFGYRGRQAREIFADLLEMQDAALKILNKGK